MSARLVSTIALSLAVLALHAWPWGPEAALAGRVLLLAVVPLAWLDRRAHLAAGLAAVALAHALIGLTGGLTESPFYPLLLVVASAAATLLSPLAAGATLAASAAVELGQTLAGAMPWGLLLAHLAFIGLFAALFAVLLRGEVAALRRAHALALDEALARVERDAQDFRLSAPLRPTDSVIPEPSDAQRKKRWIGSVRAIRAALDDVLELARVCCDADAVLFFSVDERGKELRLKTCAQRGAAPSSIERPIPATEGAIGAVVRTGKAVRLLPRDPERHLGHPSQREARAFLGVPLLEGDVLRGVLAANRFEARAFEEGDEVRLAAVGREVMRAMESERIFSAMDGARHEQERLYEAFALLNEALNVDAVGERLLEAAQRIRRTSFAAVTLYDAESEAHSVLHVVSARDAERSLAGASFAQKSGGLVAMAVKNARALPYVPLSANTGAKQRIFGAERDVELRAVKVFPLAHRGAPLGTLVVGSHEADDELSEDEERVFEVVAAHAATTLANARMYRSMEMMATTDALTGVSNRRRFLDLLDEAIARAERFRRKVSVVMIDADHFKAVNDTHGHPVGDLVLKRIAGILTAEARRTDIVGRLGGEEFVVALDETPTPGALQVAERIRERIAAEVIRAELGELRVTVSLGVATLPDHAAGRDGLLEAADQALYGAKERGRNRVEVHGRVRCNQPPEADIAHDESRALR